MKADRPPDAAAQGTGEKTVPVGPSSVLITGPEYSGEVELHLGRTYRIGRMSTCEIMLRDGLISRKHAMIQSSETGEFYVVDFGSRNGTFLNDRRLSAPAALTNGDIIWVGEHQLTFRAPAQPATERDETSGSGTKVMFVRRLVSVLVGDIRGYTAMSRGTDPELLANALGSWFRDAGRILQQHGCWTVKYIGDAVMAVWLHDDEVGQHREVVSLLQGAAEFIESANPVQERFGLPLAFQVGVGINSGIAIVGNAGTRTYADYTAMGEAVNAAFRMEACTRELQLQFAIGPSTLKSVAPFCDPSQFLSRQTVVMKGYEDPASVWAGSLEDVKKLVAALGHLPDLS